MAEVGSPQARLAGGFHRSSLQLRSPEGALRRSAAGDLRLSGLVRGRPRALSQPALALTSEPSPAARPPRRSQVAAPARGRHSSHLIKGPLLSLHIPSRSPAGLFSLLALVLGPEPAPLYLRDKTSLFKPIWGPYPSGQT